VFQYLGGAELTGYLTSWHGSDVHELTNSLRLGTPVPSQDLSGSWVTIGG
jgi:hypothetical protein